jgi:hypothetical protein
MSRASGVFKHLISSKEESLLSNIGLKNLMICFLISLNKKPSTSCSEDLLEKDILEIKTISDLTEEDFILQLNAKKLVSKDIFVSYLLFHEFKKINSFKGNKLEYSTNIAIEFDMRNSGLTLLGLISRDPACVEASFLNKSVDIYLIFAGLYKEYLNSKPGKSLLSKLPLDLKNYLISSFTGRKLVKYLVMCFVYSEKVKGRTESCLKTISSDLITEYCGESPENAAEFNKVLFVLCLKLDTFFKVKFPAMITFVKATLKIIDLIVSHNDKLFFLTPCKTKLWYNYTIVNEKQVHFFDFNLNHSSKQSAYSKGNTTDKKKHLASF